MRGVRTGADRMTVDAISGSAAARSSAASHRVAHAEIPEHVSSLSIAKWPAQLRQAASCLGDASTWTTAYIVSQVGHR